MVIVIAPDKFKGTLTAREAAEAMRQGVLAVCPDATVFVEPMADGGEGSAALLASEGDYEPHHATVPPVLPGLPDTEATYYYSPSRRHAIADVATAVGLTLVPPQRRDVVAASSEPLGCLMESMQRNHAVDSVTLCLGGTSTCDAGLGMVRYMERHHVRMPFTIGLYDAAVPLLAPAGAPSALTFAPQKGADDIDMAVLEMRLKKAARIMPYGNPELPGAGAAGGLGFAISAMGGELRAGVAAVASDRITRHRPDLVITGEGCIDRTSAMGKVLSWFTGLETPVMAVGGTVSSTEGLIGRFADIVAADSCPPLPPTPLTPDVAAARITNAVIDRLPATLERLGLL